VSGGVFLHHQRQLKRVAAARGQRNTDQAPAKPGHEIDRLRRHLVGGENEITLVLAVLVVDHDDLLSAGHPHQRLFHGDKDAVLSIRHAHLPVPRKSGEPEW